MRQHGSLRNLWCRWLSGTCDRSLALSRSLCDRSLMNVKSCQWGSVVLWELHLKPCRFPRAPALTVAVSGRWLRSVVSPKLRWAQPCCLCGRAVQTYHICCFPACLSLEEGSFFLFNIKLKSHLAAIYFLSTFFPSHWLARCVRTCRFFISN